MATCSISLRPFQDYPQKKLTFRGEGATAFQPSIIFEDYPVSLPTGLTVQLESFNFEDLITPWTALHLDLTNASFDLRTVKSNASVELFVVNMLIGTALNNVTDKLCVRTFFDFGRNMLHVICKRTLNGTATEFYGPLTQKFWMESFKSWYDSVYSSSSPITLFPITSLESQQILGVFYIEPQITTLKTDYVFIIVPGNFSGVQTQQPVQLRVLFRSGDAGGTYIEARKCISGSIGLSVFDLDYSTMYSFTIATPSTKTTVGRFTETKSGYFAFGTPNYIGHYSTILIYFSVASEGQLGEQTVSEIPFFISLPLVPMEKTETTSAVFWGPPGVSTRPYYAAQYLSTERAITLTGTKTSSLTLECKTIYDDPYPFENSATFFTIVFYDTTHLSNVCVDILYDGSRRIQTRSITNAASISNSN